MHFCRKNTHTKKQTTNNTGDEATTTTVLLLLLLLPSPLIFRDEKGRKKRNEPKLITKGNGKKE